MRACRTRPTRPEVMDDIPAGPSVAAAPLRRSAVQLDAFAFALIAIGALIAVALRRWWVRRRLRRRFARARRGEVHARSVLLARGFVIEREQAPSEVLLHVDGVARAFGVRADFIVRRRGRRFVAEVKTGERAPALDHAPTRRQLLEYALAFDVDGVLLVDVEGDAIAEISFGMPRRGPRALRLTALFATGAALGWLAARVL